MEMVRSSGTDSLIQRVIVPMMLLVMVLLMMFLFLLHTGLQLREGVNW